MVNNIIEGLQAVGRPVAYYPSISKAFDSCTVGVFLSQFMYWEGKQSDKDGWIYKRQADIQKETGLSRYEQETIRRKLRQLNVIEEKKAGAPAKLYYRFNWDRVSKIVVAYVEKNEVTKPQKKTPPPKPVKAKEEKFSLFGEMKKTFLRYHEHYYPDPGLKYEWNKKDDGQLNIIKGKLTTRNIEKFGPSVTEEQILAGWEMMLKLMPEHYVKKFFTVAKISSLYQDIVQEIYNSRNKKGNERKQKNKAAFSSHD